MRRRALRVLLAGTLLMAGGLCHAFPEGAPWEAAGPGGCSACHFGSEPVIASQSLVLSGLPERIHAGRGYRLVLRLEAADMAAAGFLLGAFTGDAPAGHFEPVDERTQAQGALVRHTGDGTALTGKGMAEWRVQWRAPDAAGGPIRFEAWANASDDDRSPLGDRIHRRAWEVPRAP